MNYRTSPAFTLPQSQKKTIYQMTQQDYSSPGPIYNTTGLGIKHKSSSHSIGNSRRTEINHWVEPTPSPADYQPQKIHKKHQVAIPKASPKEQINDNPDPGYYNPEHRVIRPKSPTYSLGVKFGSIMDEVNSNPGPGHYESKRDMPILSKSKSEKATLFTTTTRFEGPNKNPGVGDYQVSERQGFLSNKGTIGNGQRQPIKKPQTPGPSDYPKMSKFEQNIKKKYGKSFSMKLKGCFEDNHLTSQAFIKYFQFKQPEPLQFRSCNEYSIPKQKRQIFKATRLPGPSDYNSHTYAPKNSAKAVIPTSNYQPYNEIIDNPPPNAYTIQVQKGPKYTIPRAKSATLVRDHPGVGRYTISNGFQNRIGSAIPKSARTDFISKNKAGVGDYEIQEKPKEFKGTIGKSQRFKKIQTKPGPGDYYIQSIIGYKSKHG